MTKPASFRELIDLTFEGRDRFAAETGIEIGHVDVMKHRNSIAPEHWPAVVAASDRLSKGVSIEDLVALRTKRQEEKRASRKAEAPSIDEAAA